MNRELFLSAKDLTDRLCGYTHGSLTQSPHALRIFLSELSALISLTRQAIDQTRELEAENARLRNVLSVQSDYFYQNTTGENVVRFPIEKRIA